MIGLEYYCRQRQKTDGIAPFDSVLLLGFILYRTWSASRWEARDGHEPRRALHLRDQALQQGFERKPILREWDSRCAFVLSFSAHS